LDFSLEIYSFVRKNGGEKGLVFLEAQRWNSGPDSQSRSGPERARRPTERIAFAPHYGKYPHLLSPSPAPLFASCRAKVAACTAGRE
jgi:hypothetical protein